MNDAWSGVQDDVWLQIHQKYRVGHTRVFFVILAETSRLAKRGRSISSGYALGFALVEMSRETGDMSACYYICKLAHY